MTEIEKYIDKDAKFWQDIADNKESMDKNAIMHGYIDAYEQYTDYCFHGSIGDDWTKRIKS